MPSPETCDIDGVTTPTHERIWCSATLTEMVVAGVKRELMGRGVTEVLISLGTRYATQNLSRKFVRILSFCNVDNLAAGRFQQRNCNHCLSQLQHFEDYAIILSATLSRVRTQPFKQPKEENVMLQEFRK